MTLTEFGLIDRFFSRCGARRPDTVLGVGDDAALLRVPPGMDLVATLDTLVEGVHFLPGASPEALGHKALAVSLSDIAAMGADPAWATLALTLPAPDPDWLEGFGAGFCALCRAHGVELVGGDTTRGPRALSVELKGLVPTGAALRRSGARPGDRVCVTGTLGDAGLGLLALRDGLAVGDRDGLRRRLERPEARVGAGRGLRGLANAAIDVSDGLLADLGHLLEASAVGAVVWLDRLPLSAAVRRHVQETGDWWAPLAAGDDYELCFTLPQGRRGELEALGGSLGCPLTPVGEITREPGLRVLRPDGGEYRPSRRGYEHFGPDA
jgi:thiamine-monophosphate kinase